MGGVGGVEEDEDVFETSESTSRLHSFGKGGACCSLQNSRSESTALKTFECPQRYNDLDQGGGGGFIHVCVCVCVCVYACASVCVHVCVHVRVQ